MITRKTEKVFLKNIKELGYVRGDKGPWGALIGAGAGAIAGYIITALAINPDGKTNDKTNPKGLGITFGLIGGAALGFWFGTLQNEYEEYELNQYNSNLERKHTAITEIVRRGMELNKKVKRK